MRLRALLLSFVFLLLGCSTTKHQKTTESKWIYFINYSKKDAVISTYAKYTLEEAYQERTRMPIPYTGRKVYGKHDANASGAISDDNFYKVEYYVEGKLIGVREYTRKELLLDKQGELVITKQGKIKR